MFGDPLGGLLFGGETLDYFGLAIGPNIDHPANPGLPFRATKAGRYSDISGICAYGAPVQAGRPTTIKPTDRNLRSMAIVHLRKPLVRAWLLRVRWYSRRQLAASGSRKSARG
jgi:hypothetical protein